MKTLLDRIKAKETELGKVLAYYLPSVVVLVASTLEVLQALHVQEIEIPFDDPEYDSSDANFNNQPSIRINPLGTGGDSGFYTNYTTTGATDKTYILVGKLVDGTGEQPLIGVRPGFSPRMGIWGNNVSDLLAIAILEWSPSNTVKFFPLTP